MDEMALVKFLLPVTRFSSHSTTPCTSPTLYLLATTMPLVKQTIVHFILNIMFNKFTA